MKTKSNFPFILAIVLLLFVQSLMAQDKVQPAKPSLFFEKIFVHTDRRLYAAGDDLWYKAYLINAQDIGAATISKVIYVELIDPKNKVVIRNIGKAGNDGNSGDMLIPENLESGFYKLRAYTNWALNFGEFFIFEKQIEIVNETAFPKDAGNLKSRRAVMRFFPEGGSLVEGTSSLVAVKAEEFTPQPRLPLSGKIINSTGDTVASFRLNTQGLGDFTFLPLPGNTYTAIVRSGGDLQSYPLPQPLKRGLNLKIIKRGDQTLGVITCSEQAFPSYEGQHVFLKISAKGRSVLQQELVINSSSVVVPIPLKTYPTGLYLITLYDETQRPNCERLVYSEKSPPSQLQVTSSAASFAARQKVSFMLNIKKSDGSQLAGKFSLAVVDTKLVPAESTDIVSYIHLESELKGPIKDAGKYFDPANRNRLAELDQLLLTQGWRDFLWKRLADTTLNITHIPERGITLTGRVLNKKRLPVTHSNITLSAPGATNGRLFAAATDNSGNYFFDDIQFSGKQTIRLNSKDAKGNPQGTITLDTTTATPPLIKREPFALNQQDTTGSQTRLLLSSRDQVKQRRLSDTLIKLNEVKVTEKNPNVLRDRTVTGFGYKDEVLTVSAEDLRYNTLRDYIQFKSQQARVDAESNRLFFMADGKKRFPRFILNNRDALYTDVDAADVKDAIAGSYLDLPMTSVERVVIKKMLGGPSLMVSNADSSDLASTTSHKRNGTDMNPVFLIYLTLKPEAFKKPESAALQASINGYYEEREFFSPVYDHADRDKRNDARITLYWNPNGRLFKDRQSTITFYNSDLRNGFRLIIQGITETGEPFYYTKTYPYKTK